MNLIKEKVDIMLDLETLGTDPDAVILSIGAVAFDKEIISEFSTNIQIQSCLDAGLSVTGDTILWWLKQSEATRKEIYETPAQPLISALEDFATWYNQFSVKTIWGNGVAFDNVILRTAFNKVGTNCPWMFWQDRCFRTEKAVNSPLSNFKPSFKFTAHKALDDAKWQAEYLIKLIEQK